MVAREFLDRPSLEAAPALLGRVLEHETEDGLVAVLLTEVEAYAGPADAASHAYRGLTRRNAVMFGPPGHAYVYFTYGMHFCVNLVCMPQGTAEAVLLRAGEVIAGEQLARKRRGLAPGAHPAGSTSGGRGGAARDLARGPARLCQEIGIDRSQDGADVCVPSSPLRLRTGPAHHVSGTAGAGGDATARSGQQAVIRTGPRVGVREAADLPWRFWLGGEPTVSLYRPAAPRAARRDAPVRRAERNPLPMHAREVAACMP